MQDWPVEHPEDQRGMSAHALSTHAQRPTSVDWQTRFIVHIMPGVRAGALPAATHEVAWHGEPGAQSASAWHGSVLLMGANALHTPEEEPGGASRTGGGGDDSTGGVRGGVVATLGAAAGVVAGGGGVTLTVVAGAEAPAPGLDAQCAPTRQSPAKVRIHEARIDIMLWAFPGHRQAPGSAVAQYWSPTLPTATTWVLSPLPVLSSNARPGKSTPPCAPSCSVNP